MDKETIVIATLDPSKALYIVGKTAVLVDNIKITYVDKYAPTVEYLLRILRKGFGWIEVDRETIEVSNTKCEHNEKGYCTGPCAKSEKTPVKCTESKRISCKYYTPLTAQKFPANQVTIEKAGGIRGL